MNSLSLNLVLLILAFHHAFGDDRSFSLPSIRHHPEDDNKDPEYSNNKAEKISEGKRRWGDKNLRIRGKREENAADPMEKRDWNKNAMRAWGKRDENDDVKRAWNKPGLRVWRKRTEGEPEKRKWGDNKVRVWGKRAQDSEAVQKKGWDKNGPLRAWGKRQDDRMNLEEKSEKDSKRDWDRRLLDWGKRSKQQNDHQEKSSSAVDLNKMAATDLETTELKSEIVKSAIESRRKRSWNIDSNAFRNRMHYYPREGPKRSWRTNVIRVWGKRTNQ